MCRSLTECLSGDETTSPATHSSGVASLTALLSATENKNNDLSACIGDLERQLVEANAKCEALTHKMEWLVQQQSPTKPAESPSGTTEPKPAPAFTGQDAAGSENEEIIMALTEQLQNALQKNDSLRQHMKAGEEHLGWVQGQLDSARTSVVQAEQQVCT